MSRDEFEKEGLRIGKKILKGHFWEEAYSEHPYIRGIYKEYKVEIVPTYKIKGTHELQSSVDRTPFHHEYLQKKLKNRQKNEVRLLKRFLKGIQAYGADTHYNSLSGYATELLILKYKNFVGCLRQVSKWKKPVVIDLARYWNKKAVLERFPQSPLVLVDPTDHDRNVAAALSSEQMQRIIEKSKAFLKKPSLSFFFPKPISEWSPKKIGQAAKKRKIVGIYFPYPKKTIDDIVWGQIKRLAKKMQNSLEQNDFFVKKCEALTGEKKHILLLAELKQNPLPKAKERIGPPATDIENVERFLQKNKVGEFRTKKGRVVIQTKRRMVWATECLREFQKQLRAVTHPPLKNSVQKSTVLGSGNFKTEMQKNPELAKLATEFLTRKK